MGVSRKQRRAMQRKLAGISNEQAERMVHAIRENSTAKRQEAKEHVSRIADEVYEKIKTVVEPDAYSRGMADAVVLVLAFEHIDRHHTGPYLRKWLHEFDEFGEAVDDSKEGTGALLKILQDECGLDVAHEFALCEQESARRKEEKGKVP